MICQDCDLNLVGTHLMSPRLYIYHRYISSTAHPTAATGRLFFTGKGCTVSIARAEQASLRPSDGWSCARASISGRRFAFVYLLILWLLGISTKLLLQSR